MNHTKTSYIKLTSGCRACWECVKACPNHVIGEVDLPFHKHTHIDKANDCTGCLKCVKTCPGNARILQLLYSKLSPISMTKTPKICYVYICISNLKIRI